MSKEVRVRNQKKAESQSKRTQNRGIESKQRNEVYKRQKETIPNRDVGISYHDHTMKENHVIDWDSAKIVERERDNQARGVKEAVYKRILPNMNRDEGSHHLSHLYDNFLGATART